MQILQKGFQQFLIISRILAGIFPAANSSSKFVIRLSRTFYSGFSAATTISANMANFWRLGV